jgi:hypothetical protein
MDTDFQYTLLENGLDFVHSCLGHLNAAQEAKEVGAQKRHLKYALIHLCSGIELVLKERLRQEDWKLVFADCLQTKIGPPRKPTNRENSSALISRVYKIAWKKTAASI